VRPGESGDSLRAMLFLSGPMGAGKSTVARLVAERLGVPVVDLDTRIEERAGCSIATLFAREGERAFRAIERREALAVADGRAVVALGGGAVTDRETRRALLAAGTLVTLTGSPAVLAKRCGDAATRPLLRGQDAATVLAALLEERADAYAECHGVVHTDSLSSNEVAEAAIAIHRESPVVVALGVRTYRVEIGRGVRFRLGMRATDASRGDVVLVHDCEHDERPWANEAASSLRTLGRRVIEIRIPQGEDKKSLATVEGIWDRALEAGIDRRALVLGVGGGVLGDMTAFAASTLLRGVALAQIPTTLLSMVDSSVGGKTGFNSRHGKNLIGTFYQPKFVLCDVDTLSTLPDEERVAGLAEVAKSAWLDGEASVAALERDASGLRVGDPEATVRAVRMSVALKARIVAADEMETGDRMLLNLGHTVGHGLEAAGNYTALRHGEAVSLGMVAALRVGRSVGAASEREEKRMIALLGSLGLPVDLDSRLDDRAFGFLAADKKKAGAAVRFVVPGEPGKTRIEPMTIPAIRRAVSRNL